MGREVKRVPADFDWPLNEVWQGYLQPDELDLPKCPDCDGRGYSPRALALFDLWYGYAPFSPADNGSVSLTPDTPAVREFAERNVAHSPRFYGTGEPAVRREAERLSALWNGQWSHHVNADDVAALIKGGRLWSLAEGEVPTPDQVNEWTIRTLGHDSINAHVVIRARCEREGVPTLCDRCKGVGDVGTPEQRAAQKGWTLTEPPKGIGWQLWETVSEGSPISPAFASAEDLAQWMTENDCTVGGPMPSFEAALRFVRAGWAPSLIGTPETGVIGGAEFIGMGADDGR